MTERATTNNKDEFSLPKGMSVYYMGLLWRDPTWSPEVTPEVEATQVAHLAHVESMHKAGHLVIAGPFLDDGDLRGIFLFKTESEEAALAMASADQAVISGR